MAGHYAKGYVGGSKMVEATGGNAPGWGNGEQAAAWIQILVYLAMQLRMGWIAGQDRTGTFGCVPVIQGGMDQLASLRPILVCHGAYDEISHFP